MVWGWGVFWDVVMTHAGLPAARHMGRLSLSIGVGWDRRQLVRADGPLGLRPT
ncbi:hypothetical protein ABT075_38760 [Streptomyces sp. NPDC002677]|uniref:hypothetical protein n=1 Tax=Streptomyces sp. NPDC002677 TaxID=3154774 RepID=UPI003327E911